eukprot:7668112-Alexandrium_andersonii.AAC.1
MSQAEKCYEPMEVWPRKPWISSNTLALVQARQRLLNEGSWVALANTNKNIQRSPKRDRIRWVEDTLQASEWAPVRALTRARAPRVVALERAPELDSGRDGNNAQQHPKPAE